MTFKRKAYDKLLKWKNESNGKIAILLEGARRVGKSTLAEEFAKNEYKSHILIDFSNTSNDIKKSFDDISNLDAFFLKLQTYTGITLFQRESVIIFDEIQLFPRARQAIKHLVADGRYDYIETGSLISIKKNVKNILIPSEETKLPVYPMDYEEFMWAIGNNTYNLIRDLFNQNKPLGQELNRKLMRDFRLYMAVGGMPQAVLAYAEGKNFTEIDNVKRSIIELYEDDFKKIDSSGRIFAIYKSIPAQLSRGVKRFSIATAKGSRKTQKDDELLFDLLDSKTTLVSYNTTDPKVSLSLTKDFQSYKLYLADTGLFVTLLFNDQSEAADTIYKKLLSDKLPANLGYLYENAVAQAIKASGRELYYHTWEKKDSTHYYEVDFLLSKGTKQNVIEVKSSGTGKHESISEFKKKYSKTVSETFILSQKDISRTEEGHQNLPIFMIPFLAENYLQ